jgi:hypothetical protein
VRLGKGFRRAVQVEAEAAWCAGFQAFGVASLTRMASVMYSDSTAMTTVTPATRMAQAGCEERRLVRKAHTQPLGEKEL